MDNISTGVTCAVCGRPRFLSTSNSNYGKLRTCTFCRQKRWSDANAARISADNKARYECDREAYKTRAASWYKDNPAECRLRMWHGKLRRKGASPEYYEAKLTEQNGRCAICGISPKKRRLDLDHDHASDPPTPRGIICNVCNRQVGFYEKAARLGTRPIWRKMKHKIPAIEAYLNQYKKGDEHAS